MQSNIYIYENEFLKLQKSDLTSIWQVTYKEFKG